MNAPEYEQTIAIFIDILGSKNTTGFEEKYNIHTIFHNSILDNQDRESSKGYVAYTRKLYSFSDCTFIFYKYKPGITDNRKDINKLFQVALFNSSNIVLELFNAGYIVRGGITCGDVFFDDMSFFGPAVDRAYELESKKAVTPRILIDPMFGANLLEHENKIYSEVFGETSPHYGHLPKRSYIPSISIRDGEDFILNPLYILEMEGEIPWGDGTISHQNLTNKLLQKVNSQIPDYPWDHKVRPKLEWMKQYLEKSQISLIRKI
ncbi:hypothetical protein CCX46_09725 [Pseudomonas sp. RU47]|uniref:hypothetical protein n=1 Tax=Pseudomonas sp. RU47 TaxID=2005388 RepID=UPI000FDF0089|nr:hypothetical protein [Pseudomonas sp. RU47]AZZ75420.1 hypothetical protein CCX46_09725 [Pseudomonas sp. RU47]